jgi:hypothetical protein
MVDMENGEEKMAGSSEVEARHNFFSFGRKMEIWPRIDLQQLKLFERKKK